VGLRHPVARMVLWLCCRRGVYMCMYVYVGLDVRRGVYMCMYVYVGLDICMWVLMYVCGS